MKKLLFTGLFAALIVACFAQKPYKVVFYNFENLFDTIRNPEIYDEEFTPEGPKKWNTPKYTKKINNLSRVLFDIAAINKDYPVVIGVSEIENRNVMEDVIATPKLAPANYRHRALRFARCPRRGRGVLLPSRRVQARGQRPDSVYDGEPAEFPHARRGDDVGDDRRGTVLFHGGPLAFAPGGKEASAPKRERAAEIMRHAADSVLAINPATKVVMMGDFNDDATDKSITEVLGAEGNIRKLQPGGYYNPFIDMLKAGIGSLAYRDQWNLFDNIVVSENLATGSTGSLKLERAPKGKYYGNIFRVPYLFQQEGQYKGYPLRTFVGNNFQGGYSDHLPVFIYIGK